MKNQLIDISEYKEDVTVCFDTSSELSTTFFNGAKESFKKIEKILQTAPAFVNLVKGMIPKHSLQAILTDDQKKKIASGALKLMTKKDGSILAVLVDPKTKKIVGQVPLKDVSSVPNLSQAVTGFISSVQMAKIAEEIHEVQKVIEEVRRGQENDRLALAYSCKQKLLQTLNIRNKRIREISLLKIASDAEDSRNQLMLSQRDNVDFIKNQPSTFLKKMISGSALEKIDARMEEIRESLATINTVSLTEAIAYQNLGENEAAVLSLRYYGEHISNTFMKDEGLLERLDQIDSQVDNYWTNRIPVIVEHIKLLPEQKNELFLGGEKHV